MISDDALSLQVFGLEKDAGFVRAEVFARQMSLIARALRAADKYVNGQKRHNFIVRDLQCHSAFAVIREKPLTRKAVSSGTVALCEVFDRVYRGDTRAERYPRSILTPVSGMALGAPRTFNHTEIGYDGSKVVRLDEFFISQASSILTLKREAASSERDLMFKGTSRATFDGELVVIDRRGQSLRGKLTLTAGRKEIDCTIRRELFENVLRNFEKRLRVSGLAIYDGSEYLPQRFDVEQISLVGTGQGLNQWRGQFLIPDDEHAYPWGDE